MTPRRPIRRLVAVAVTAGATVLALGGCTPSGLQAEARTTRSAYAALTGNVATGDVSCSLRLRAKSTARGDQYTGDCVVHGTSFRMESYYREVGSDRTTATVAAAIGYGTMVRVHTCTFDRSGTGRWRHVQCTSDDRTAQK